MKRRLPSLSAAKAFEAAARHLSFRAAAEELSVTHSAISHQVKSLEAQLGVPLFRRGPQSVSLTEAGKVLYPILRESFDESFTVELTRNVDGAWFVGRNSSNPPSLAELA